MGGSGGAGRYFDRSTREDRQRLLDQAKQGEQQQRLEGDTNQYLQEVTVRAAQADPEKTNEYLDAVQQALGDMIEIDRILFGGSVAKHTFVDGISDIDALVVLDDTVGSADTPRKVRDAFLRRLRARLSQADVRSMTAGTLAITIKYRDGTELQLLPAVRAGKHVAISNESGSAWIEIRPRKFMTVLSTANQRMNGALVPAIKIAKSINDNLPEQKKLTGYHLEALAVEAVRSYDGACTKKALVLRLFSEGARLVGCPLQDVTRQSRYVDAYLGPAGSVNRQVVRDSLSTIFRRLNAAVSVDDWRRLIEGSPA